MQFNYSGPYMVIPIPINQNGEGPEIDPAKVVSTQYQVWDGEYQTIATFRTPELAKEVAYKLSLADNVLETIQRMQNVYALANSSADNYVHVFPEQGLNNAS